MPKLYVTLSIKSNDHFIRMIINGVMDSFVMAIDGNEFIGEIYLN